MVTPADKKNRRRSSLPSPIFRRTQGHYSCTCRGYKMMAEEHLHQNQADTLLQVSPSQITRRRAKSSSLHQATRPNSLQLHKGPAEFFAKIDEKMVSYMSEWCGKGMDVSCLSLIRKACQLSPGFASKSLGAQKACISCFMMQLGLTHCMATHAAQRPPEEVT